MDYKLVDERIQSMMKTVNSIKDGTGMEYVSPETYTAFYDLFSEQLESEYKEELSEDVFDKSDYYLNKAIEALEESKHFDFDSGLSTYINLAINDAAIDRLIILYDVKRKFLELYRDA